ncbi:MAG: Ku protein [Bacteroidetes bacterium]|nr:Ku protein [Bacteroidota bacterium]
MRAIWSGAINFGLVNIPVKVYSATNQHRLDLDMLDKKDHSRIRYARISTGSEKEIPFEDIVKGYKVGDEYVVVEKEDFEKVSPEKSKTIDIVDFIEEDDIDSMYYEKPYFLEPDKTAARPYALLRDALKKSKKVGIAIFVFRNKQHIGVIKPSGNALILNQIRYADELRSPDELNLPGEQAVKGKEIEMALALIEQSTSDFDPSQYKDEYTAELLKLIEQKAQGKTVKSPKTKIQKPTKPDDLMELLKASLQKRKEARTSKPKQDRRK